MNEQDVRRLRRLTKIRTKKELSDWALWLLQWVVHQHQRGCSIFAINEKAGIRQELDLPLLQQIDLQATTAPLSEYPAILGEQVKHLIEAGRIEEAEEAVKVMKSLRTTSKDKRSPTEGDQPSVPSSMNLEAAKIMAEEGDLRSAVTLVEETNVEPPNQESSKEQPS
jgi:hypothetical protein